ncbi:glycerophosphodiester phosphodiesterase family protein [Sinomonas sp. ASV322]|uniref:glycerophosphodiester phosphodiesterase n=1 Tax=Sinomonas sp. ASV322 TaxID=3041920 RepID=UPI0027DD12A6|nr:glycerophosphodiester phosphodiesterase family protein [Sinomonas sp. ASV322]MDQ4501320.1 glycerophosphodiester phosphodiesterase family protein [Sinomonas sp. ASV322]
MTTERPLVYAHRGASAQFAEHTRAAYLQAIADGADGVECDVHLTRDQHVVLLHDPNLDRTSNGTGPVADRTLDELRDLDFSSWKGARIPVEYGAVTQQLLTLPELLDLLADAGREIGLAIELKHPSPYQLRLEDTVLGILADRGWDAWTSKLGNVLVSFMSFDADAVRYLLDRVPAEHVCMLVDDVHLDDVRADLALGRLTGGAVANMLKAAQAEAEAILDGGHAGIAGPGIGYVRNHPNRVRDWLADGRRFRVWTVDKPEDVDHCLATGIQEITTNRPAEVLDRVRAAVV